MNKTVDVNVNRSRTSRSKLGLGSIAASVLGLFALTAGNATANPIASGSTALKLDKPIAKVLKANGVKVVPIKPARVKGGAVSFPVTGGNLDPATAAGTIRHSGGLRFQAGGAKLATTKFVVKTGRNNVLRAMVGGAQVNLLKLDLKKAKITRPGFGINVSRVGVSLTGAAAKALNTTFGVKLFRQNLRLGHVVVKTQPVSVGLAANGSTDLALDPGTAQALTDLGVSAAPIGPASVTPGGELSFPITGGRANVSSFAGSINHSGGISLSAGETVVELTDFRINVDNDPDLTALVGGQRVSILSLDLSGLETGVKGKRITLANAVGKLTADAAAALNAAFGVTAFTEGLVLGTATVNAVAR